MATGVAANKVTDIIAQLSGWAEGLLSSANGALETLAATEISPSHPYYIGSVSLEDISHYLNDISRPGDLALDTAPAVIAMTLPITHPVKPDTTMPILGAMRDIVLPDIPTVVFPSIDITPPIYNIPAPTQWNFDISAIPISDDPLVMEMISRLTKNIRYGGTGLSEAVETAIWNRDLERNEQQLQDTTDKMVQAWAKMGFTLPDGMLAHSIAEVQKEYMNKMLDRTREIAIKQAELEQVNLFKSIELGISLTTKIIELLIQYEKLSLECQELTAKYANEYIKIQLEAYIARVEAYKALAQAYEVIIRAELAKVEIYKAQIEGQKLIGDINQQTVQIYSEKMKAIAIMVDAYKSEIQAMTAEVEMEKTKIEANKLQFDAWAKKAEVLVAKYNGEVDMYKSESLVNISKAEAINKANEAEAKINLAYVELKVKSLEANNRAMDLKANILMEAQKGVATAYSSMAAGLMAAISAHSQLGYSETMSGQL